MAIKLTQFWLRMTYEKWLKTVLYKHPYFNGFSFRDFFESDAQFILWPDEVEPNSKLYTGIYDNFGNSSECFQI